MCSCQLFVIHYLFICARHSLFVVHLFCSLLNYLFRSCLFSFLIDSMFYSLFKREKNNSDPELVFRYFDPITCKPSSIQVNKHHTADSTDFVLVQERRTYNHHRRSRIDKTNISTQQIVAESETVSLRKSKGHPAQRKHQWQILFQYSISSQCPGRPPSCSQRRIYSGRPKYNPRPKYSPFSNFR